MRKIFLLAFAAATLAACQQTKPKTDQAAADTAAHTETAAVASPDAPVMSFESGMYNFGKIVHGEKVHHEYKFTNTGKTPLIITNATATCGCTIPEPPKEPIKPGASGVIKVEFNSEGKMGMQDKIITITSNGNPSTSELHLIGEVTEK